MIKTLLNDNKNEKVLFDLHIDGKEQTKRISSKILKIDENNQYGQAMKKPLPYGCIKKEHPPSFIKFNRILNGLSHNDIIGHLFKVNITFNNINAKHYYSINCTLQYLKKIKRWKHLRDLLFNF